MVGRRGATRTDVSHLAQPMFYGAHEHTVDDKNRVTLPAKFRDAFGRGVVLAKGIDRNIDVYPRASWEASMSRIAALDPLTREAREMKRYFFAAASAAELDKQGRVVIPADLSAHAGIGKDVVVAGVHDHVEIWDRAQWADHVSAIEGSVGDVAERAADRRS
jgi:MraZ protein